MIRATVLSLVLSALATQCAALSCMRPDVARAFTWAAEAEEPYIGLLGTIEFASPFPGGQRPMVMGMDPEDVSVTARFAGQGLGSNGFGPTDLDSVELVFSCAGPWCGTIEPGAHILAFAERTHGTYRITVGPCLDQVFVDPSRDDIARVEACMRGETCAEWAPRGN